MVKNIVKFYFIKIKIRIKMIKELIDKRERKIEKISLSVLMLIKVVVSFFFKIC